jgi:hypothetical protein
LKLESEADFGSTPASCYDIQQVYEKYTGPNGVLGAATDAEAPLPDGIGRNRIVPGDRSIAQRGRCVSSSAKGTMVANAPQG